MSQRPGASTSQLQVLRELYVEGGEGISGTFISGSGDYPKVMWSWGLSHRLCSPAVWLWILTLPLAGGADMDSFLFVL